jgi:hypothetical protein
MEALDYSQEIQDPGLLCELCQRGKLTLHPSLLRESWRSSPFLDGEIVAVRADKVRTGRGAFLVHDKILTRLPTRNDGMGVLRGFRTVTRNVS